MAKKRKQKSETLIVLIGLVIIVLGVIFIKKPQSSVDTDPKGQTPNTLTPITITKNNIKEVNFTGSKAVILGSGAMADAARMYINETIELFKQSADAEVPPMRSEFGADSPSANYEIELNAKYVRGQKTESIIIDQYVYTGGANGSSSFKVFTASRATGKLLSLGNVIIPSKQEAFTALVKKELNEWRPEGSTEIAVFPEDVNTLTFSSFRNWSYNDRNLILYFDKYEIGPGVLGAVAFPLPLSKIQGFLTI